MDLLFANREGLGVAGGHLEHRDHEIIVFNSWRSKEGNKENC